MTGVEKVSQFQLEYKEKNNQIGVVNDEDLPLQKQLAVTKQKLEQLNQKHEALINLWMAKAEFDANLMKAVWRCDERVAQINHVREPSWCLIVFHSRRLSNIKGVG